MALQINDLVIHRGTKAAVNGVSFNLEAGKITALLGPNGAGKSSLVLALGGVIPVSKGSVMLDGKMLSGKTPDFVRRSGVSVVPEGHRVLSPMSVDDNLLAAGFALNKAELKDATECVYGVFPELAERKSQLAGTMSGGQQQMLALGQALVSRPKYILADEMSFGLAPVIIRRLMQVVRDLAKAGTGILLIEQFTDVALSLADEAHVMRQGKFTFSGVPELLQKDPGILHSAYLGGK